MQAMPIFEYACEDCGRQFEAFVTASRHAGRAPAARRAKLAKLLSSPGMVGGRGASRRVVAAAVQAAAARAATRCACRMN